MDQEHIALPLSSAWTSRRWAIETARTTTQAVFDLDDPRDHALVRLLYGDPEAWEKSGNTAGEKDLPLTAALRLRLERAVAATA